MRSTAKERMVKTKIVLRLQETNKQYYTEHKEYNLIWRGTTPVMYSDAFFEDLITHIDTKAIDLCNENKYLQLEIGKCLQNKNSRKAMMNLNETYAINDHVKAQALKCVQYQTSLPSDHCSPTTPTKCTFGLTYSKLSLAVNVQHEDTDVNTPSGKNASKNAIQHVLLDIPCMTIFYQNDRHILEMHLVSHEEHKHHKHTCWHFMRTSTMTQQGQWKLQPLHSINLTRKPPHLHTNQTTVQIPHRDRRLLSRSIHLTARQTCSLHESAWNFPMLTSTPLYNAWSSTLVDNKVVLFTIMFT